MAITGPLAATLLAALLTLPACESEPEKDESPETAETAEAEAEKPAEPAGPLPIVAVGMAGLPSSFVIGDFLFAGQPTPEGLVNARDSGARLVINTRTEAEMSFDERSIVQGLGMRYISLPFTPASLDDVLVETFIFEVKQHKPEEGKVLLHCASGGRIAGLWAMYEIKELKVDPVTAVERARELSPKLSDEMVVYIGEYARRIGAM